MFINNLHRYTLENVGCVCVCCKLIEIREKMDVNLIIFIITINRTCICHDAKVFYQVSESQ